MWIERFRPEISEDLQEGAHYYNTKREGLGDEFLDEFWNAIEKIIERPFSFAVASTGSRACRIRRFSYVIHFRVFKNEILFVAVMSSWRDSSAWQTRIER